MERYFNGTQISLAGKTFSQAETMAGQYFRLSPSEWKGHRYDVKTLAFLEKHEVREGAFAHLCRYQFSKEHEGAEEGFYFYRICLQDDRILDAVERAHSFIRLSSLLLYIAAHELVHVIRFEQGEAHGAHRLDDIAGAGFALGPYHGRPLADTAQGLTEVAAAADEGHLEIVLPDVVFLIGRREHLRFIDVVHPQGFQTRISYRLNFD